MRHTFFYTPEQAKLINLGDIEARNRFYEDNLGIIRGMARCYVQKARTHFKRYDYEFEDIVQQIWLDLPYVEFREPWLVPYTMRRLFFYTVYGGYAQLKESRNSIALANRSDVVCYEYLLVDTPRYEDGSGSYIDRYAFAPSAETVACAADPEECAECLKIALSGLFAPKAAQVFSMYIDGYGMAETARQMKVSDSTVNVHKKHVFDKLRKRCDEVLNLLESMGYDMSEYANMLPDSKSFLLPCKTPHRMELQRKAVARYRAKMTPEQEAVHLAKKRAYANTKNAAMTAEQKAELKAKRAARYQEKKRVSRPCLTSK